jgi:hypothetical protein
MMTEPRCGSLARWSLEAEGFRQKLDRRAMLGSALVAGTAGLLLSGRPATALSMQDIPPAWLGAVPERAGVLPWRTLGLAKVEYGRKPNFPATVQKLDRREVVVEGHMMPLDDSERVQRLLLTAYKAHCPFCMPGGVVSIIAVRAQTAIPLKDTPLTLRGTLRLISERGSGLLYRLEKARVA